MTGQIPIIQERVKWTLSHAFLYKIVHILDCTRLARRLRQGCRVAAFVEVKTNALLRSCYFVDYSSHSPDNKSTFRLTACTYWSNKHRVNRSHPVNGASVVLSISYRHRITIVSQVVSCVRATITFRHVVARLDPSRHIQKFFRPKGAVVCACPTAVCLLRVSVLNTHTHTHSHTRTHSHTHSHAHTHTHTFTHTHTLTHTHSPTHTHTLSLSLTLSLISLVYSQISVLNISVSKDVYFFFVPGVVITVASYFY